MGTFEFTWNVYAEGGKDQNGFEDTSIWNYLGVCSARLTLPSSVLSFVTQCMSDIRAQEDLELSDFKTDKPHIYLIFYPHPKVEHNVLTKRQITVRNRSHYSLISSTWWRTKEWMQCLGTRGSDCHSMESLLVMTACMFPYYCQHSRSNLVRTADAQTPVWDHWCFTNHL